VLTGEIKNVKRRVTHSTTQHKLVVAEAERRRINNNTQNHNHKKQKQAMGFVGDTVDSIKSLQIRQVLHQGVSLGQFPFNPPLSLSQFNQFKQTKICFYVI
jgi:hypothetical protein